MSDFEQGYRDGLRASDVLGEHTSKEELQAHIEQAMDLGLVENAGYWAGRMTTYGTDPMLDDGTMLSY